MKAHNDRAAEYEKLKMELAEKYKEDRISYTKGKEAFIQGIYKEMQI